MKKILKYILFGLLAIFVLLQLVPRNHNNTGVVDGPYFIGNNYPASDSVQAILSAACYDCHSNKTVYPWYASVQPFALWLNHHVDEGKEHFNFSEFTNKPLFVQFHKLEEMEEEVADGKMPLDEYTWLHGNAKLTDNQKAQLVAYSRAVRADMRAKYPADSLKFPKRK